MPRVAALIDGFRNRKLSDAEALTFAEQALLLRFDRDKAPIEPRTLLTQRRPENQASDLWTVFNRVQENLVRGGLSDSRRSRAGRLRSLRSLRGLDSKISLNTGLWKLAEASANSRN